MDIFIPVKSSPERSRSTGYACQFPSVLLDTWCVSIDQNNVPVIRGEGRGGEGGGRGKGREGGGKVSP